MFINCMCSAQRPINGSWILPSAECRQGIDDETRFQHIRFWIVSLCNGLFSPIWSAGWVFGNPVNRIDSVENRIRLVGNKSKELFKICDIQLDPIIDNSRGPPCKKFECFASNRKKVAKLSANFFLLQKHHNLWYNDRRYKKQRKEISK